MRWEPSTLPSTSEPGYGERALPATEFVKFDARPTVVWFFSPEDETENQTCEATVFQNEKLGLALKRFRTVKVDVETINDAKLRRQYSNTPAFHVIDPKGRTIARIEGKQATSLSRFSGMMKTAWTKLFAMNQRTFVKSMTKILNRLDVVSSQTTVLAAKRQRLQGKNNRAKLAAIAREEAELAEVKAEIEKDESQVIENCLLKSAYRTEKDEVAAR